MGASERPADPIYWARFISLQLILGPVIGFAISHYGGLLVGKASEAKWMSPMFQRISALAMAVLIYAAAEFIGGNGFIAAFCGGLALGIKQSEICDRLHHFAEAEGQLLTLLMFMVFGAVLAPFSWEAARPTVFLYAFLSLTVVRLASASISLIGKKLKASTILFLGWFGPRGLASIIYTLVFLEIGHKEVHPLIWNVVMVTVLASVFLHGLTAAPAARWYGRRAESWKPAVLEKSDVPHMSLKNPLSHQSKSAAFHRSNQ
jgi:NhaP-type Na+/H+ or K+/H+ antiporter